MEIILGRTAGFCYGVKNAVSNAEEKLKELTTINPRLVLQNKRIDIEEPHKIELSFKEKLAMLKGESLRTMLMNLVRKD